MRTTLSLDDDVAAMLTRVRESRKLTLKQAANEALREGLQRMTAPRGRQKPFRTKAARLGRCLIGSLDDVSEALALAEGESYR